MTEKTYTNISSNSLLEGLPSYNSNVLFGKSRIASNYWIKNYENLDGWLFGDFGTFEDTNLKCCNIHKEELLHVILGLPNRLEPQDKVIIIDRKLFDVNTDLEKALERIALLHDIATSHNLTIMLINRHEED